MSWSDVGEVITHPAVAAGLRVVGMVAAAFAVSHLLRRSVRRIEQRVADQTSPLRTLQRTQTLAKVATSAGIVTTWCIAGIYALSELGFDLAPLLAGVGIVGLAVGFGAQNLVRDVVTGFFILLEDQFGIGDIVQVDSVGGKVETLTLRVTGLRDLDGTMHYIANGNIGVVSNRTKEWSRAVIDVGVGYGENLDHVRSVLERVAADAKAEPELGRRLHSAPEILGVESLGEYEVVIRMVAETKPGKQFDVAREIRARVKTAFDAEGIEVPFPHRVMIHAGTQEKESVS